MKPIKITSVAQLRSMLYERDWLEGYILLWGGARSSKLLSVGVPPEVIIEHYIDDSTEVYHSLAELCEKTNLGAAIKVGAFYVDNMGAKLT